MIAVLIPDLQLGFYGEVLKELIEQIPKYNYRIVFIPTIAGSEHYKIFFKEMNIAAAYEGTKYLISLGHEKIVFLSDYLRNISSCFQRFTGCKRALDEIGIDIKEEEMLGCGPVTYDTGYRLTKQFLEKKIIGGGGVCSMFLAKSLAQNAKR